MDDLDKRLVRALQRDGRAALSTLAADLKVTRATVRARLARLEAEGEITGYTVLTRRDPGQAPVRGLMMLAIEGPGTDRVMGKIAAMPEVRAIHTTNGAWDLIAEIGTATLEQFDAVLFAIRRLHGVTGSETNLLLSTRRGR
ncbi:Lrp/AsnC family transcriptional regulator [Histidinibacterium aquaticum]|uniref:Lrp/AsnC family transcriptional regulator n=1 Tax=Histidinibacterium aquaticum TaxID=2613962 RepID=A0A5J5GNX2_9RHOB|nr:Lrp/AsnC family transcriptional regulator [Histidinibacterium aquaticum]KAA9009142.1 Lrp/AsnC family transcriptional regulator [Histidinibacterium aquaticum]